MTAAAAEPKNHAPTIRLLGEQVGTALKACGELRSDYRALDDVVDEIQIEIAKLKERATLVAGLLAVIQVVAMAIAAYMAGR